MITKDTTPDIRCLAEFKRWLRLPGATVRLVSHDWGHRAIGIDRTVSVLQSGAVQFSDGSWLRLAPAAEFRFAGDTVSVSLGGSADFSAVMVYRLRLSGG